jgi:hypothetical protein
MQESPKRDETPQEGEARHTGLRAFGLSLRIADPPPGAWEERPLGAPLVHLRSATPRAVAESWSGLDAIGWKGVIDGAPFVGERGRAGDHRFVHEGRAVHHLCADATILLCGPDGDGEPLRWRVILDSVLFSVALIRGYEALHAAAFATPVGAVAITAGTGGGKSTLLAELIRRGHALISDDVVVLEPRPDAPPLAHPGPPLMTVPRGAGDGLGTVIAPIGDERWVALAAQADAVPLAALVLLDRRPGATNGLHRIEAPLVALIGSLLAFPRQPERERARFELASALASHTAVWRLAADSRTDPRTLADLLLADLPTLARAAGTVGR